MTKRNQKDTLAKLMATENITVVHKKIPTAYFDVKNRILACPIFKEDISDELYDLFMGHEVGHALNTPYEGLHSALELNRTLKGYLNVVEDVRIEKAIKNKFQGLRKSFFTAYNELMEMDFFQIKKRDLSTLSLIDKINLQTKVGSRLGLQFNTVEQGFLDMAEACKTWEDVVECATAIYEYSKENETRTEDDEMLVPQMFDVGDDEENEEGDESEEFESSNEDYEDDSDESIEDGEDNLPEIGDNVDQGDTEEEEVDEETETDEEAENQVKSTGGKEGGKDQGYHDDENGARESITEHYAHNNEDQFLSEENVIMSSINLKETFKNNDMNDVVVPFKTVLSDWKKYISDESSYYSEERRNKEYSRGCFAAKRLENKNKKIVAHMAKEFEMKQSAKISKKAFTGKTGKLDMNRLAKYQIVDDIFKRAVYLPEGQNHGLNVLVDWSGSISDEVTDLLEQSMILAEFCRKTNIPYRVYLFSDCYRDGTEKEDEWGYSDNGGRLIEMLSNEMNNRQHKEMMTYMGCMYANYFSQKIGWRNYQKSIEKYNEFFGEFEALSDDGRYWDIETNFRPQNYRLGGTPLDQTLVALRKLLPEFNAKYNVEKSILTVITDGFSHSADFLQLKGEERKDIEEQEKNLNEDSWRCMKGRNLIDPYLNKVFTLQKPESGYGYRSTFEVTQNLLHWLSETCDVTVTGYFVLGRKADLYNIMPFVRGENFYDYDSAWREIRKEGKVFKCHGYNKLFITHANNMHTEGSDELGEEFVDAKKVRVMAAFKRNQKSKTTSRFLTNEFIKEIA